MYENAYTKIKKKERRDSMSQDMERLLQKYINDLCNMY